MDLVGPAAQRSPDESGSPDDVTPPSPLRGSDAPPARAAKFRMTAKNLMLTYDNTDNLPENDVIVMLKEICNGKGFVISKIIYVTEKHASGHPHVHVAIKFAKKINIKDPRVFDLIDWKEEQLHPNIKKGAGKGAWNQLVAYVSKTGFAKGDSMMWEWKNYKKNKADWDHWQSDMKSSHADPAWPIKLPDGALIMEPKCHQRKYIYLIMGDPDKGKSYWRKKAIKPYTSFRVTNVQYPMEGYNGQQIIIYDDFDFDKIKGPEHLLITNGEYEYEQVKVGHCRYQDAVYPENQQRIVIIICNAKPAVCYKDMIASRMAYEYTFQ